MARYCQWCICGPDGCLTAADEVPHSADSVRAFLADVAELLDAGEDVTSVTYSVEDDEEDKK